MGWDSAAAGAVSPKNRAHACGSLASGAETFATSGLAAQRCSFEARQLGRFDRCAALPLMT
ncbi:hypothetical protein [Streptomyces mirabilis]|uniref:hypothetical protein n=1 Tax=Streptomyces mirabilis TaxID=68239 RepID=UPI0038226B74